MAVTVTYLTDFGRHIFFRKGKGISLKVPLSPEKSKNTLEMIEIVRLYLAKIPSYNSRFLLIKVVLLS